MFGISWDQVSGLVQRALMFAGGFVVAKGYISEALMIQIVGALMSIAGVLWGVKVNTQAALVQSVDAMPNVAAVIPKATPEGRALAAAVDSPTVAPAGTGTAKALAT